MASSRDASRETDADIERGADDDIEGDGRPAPAPRAQRFGSAHGVPTLDDFLRSAHMGHSQNHGFFGRLWTGLKRFIFTPGPAEEDMVPDYRLLPILSGIVVPFSILLEVPGLLERWYIRTSGGHTVEVRNNPMILTVGMGISMACGVLANVFLLMRFLEKRPRQATLAAIVALTLHDVINIITVTVFGVVHRVNDGFTYGESFWITVCSTIASTFVNITLIYDFHTTTDFATKGSGLTRKQRSLVIVIMIFLVYVAFGACINHVINDLNFVNSLYFTIVSVTTIGYGDIVPLTTGARIFNAFYIVGGILNLSLVLVIARETIVEVFEQGFRRRKHALAERRKQHRRHRFEQAARRQAIERQLENAGYQVYVEKRSKLTGQKKTKLNEKMLTKEQMCDAIEEAHEVTEKIDAQLAPNDPHRSALGLSTPANSGTPEEGKTLVAGPSEFAQQQQTVEMATGTSAMDGATGFVQALQQELGTARMSWEAQEESYRQFQAQIEHEESKDRTAKLVVAWSIFLTFWLVGAAIFSATEGWTYGIGLWWSFVTFSTIGDFSPTSSTGRAVFTAWALFGVAAMTILISVLGETYANRYHSLVRDQAFERAMQNIRNHNAPNTAPASPAASADSLHDNDGNKLPKSLAAIHDTLGQISTDMITCARRLHEDLHFLSTASAPDAVIPPERLEAMLRDVEELNVQDGKLKDVLMQDTAAKKTLFMLGYENRLRKLIDQAELLAVQLAHKTDEIRETDELVQRYGELRGLFSSDLKVARSEGAQQLTRRSPYTRGDDDADEESDPNLPEAEPTARTSALRASVSRSISRSRSRAS